MNKLFLITATVFLSGSLFASDAAINARIASMKDIGSANRELVNISRGRAAFDADVVQAAANTLKENSGQYLLDLFPEGSTAARSDAKPEIWSNWAKFSQLAFDLNSASTKLAQASEADFAALYADVSATCSSCHKDFRK